MKGETDWIEHGVKTARNGDPTHFGCLKKTIREDDSVKW